MCKKPRSTQATTSLHHHPSTHPFLLRFQDYDVQPGGRAGEVPLAGVVGRLDAELLAAEELAGDRVEREAALLAFELLPVHKQLPPAGMEEQLQLRWLKGRQLAQARDQRIAHTPRQRPQLVVGVVGKAVLRAVTTQIKTIRPEITQRPQLVGLVDHADVHVLRIKSRIAVEVEKTAIVIIQVLRQVDLIVRAKLQHSRFIRQIKL